MDNWAVREQARVKRTKLSRETIQEHAKWAVGYKYNTRTIQEQYKLVRRTNTSLKKRDPKIDKDLERNEDRIEERPNR